jgi:hypothetical protein
MLKLERPKLRAQHLGTAKAEGGVEASAAREAALAGIVAAIYRFRF